MPIPFGVTDGPLLFPYILILTLLAYSEKSDNFAYSYNKVGHESVCYINKQNTGNEENHHIVAPRVAAPLAGTVVDDRLAGGELHTTGDEARHVAIANSDPPHAERRGHLANQTREEGLRARQGRRWTGRGHGIARTGTTQAETGQRRGQTGHGRQASRRARHTGGQRAEGCHDDAATGGQRLVATAIRRRGLRLQEIPREHSGVLRRQRG